jgi:C_GCAxxG_C_C family probable redox protein
MNDVERAVACFDTKFNCCQSIISTYGPKFGLDRDSCLKIAEVFGGGMASSGNVCGVVTGAFMVIGLNSGRTRDDDEQAKEIPAKNAEEFIKKFKERNGSTLCKALINYDLSIPENRIGAKEKGVFDNCGELVRDAAEILEELINRKI